MSGTFPLLTNLTAAPFSSLIGPTSSLVIGQFLLRARHLLVQVSQHRRALAGSNAARPRAPLAQRFLAREEDADGARASSRHKDTGFKWASSLALVRSAALTESAGCASVQPTARSAMLVLCVRGRVENESYQGLRRCETGHARPIYGVELDGMVERAEGAFGTCQGAHSTALPRSLCASIAYIACI